MSNQTDVTSRSYSYEDFSTLVRSEGLNVRKQIDSIYRYQDDEGKERFFYHETRKARRGDKEITCATGHIGNSSQFPTSEEFEWKDASLAKISKHFIPMTQFYIVLGGRNRSKITKDQFMTWDRTDIELGFKQVKVDIQELASQIAAATAAKGK